MKYFLSIACILSWSLLSIVSAQEATDSRYWSPIEPFRILIDPAQPEQKTLISRWDAIGADLKASPHHAGGTYTKNGYRGYFLRWSAEHGYVYVYHSEGLSIIDLSYGQVRVTPEAVFFLPERDMRETFRNRRLTLAKKWIILGDYFVPRSEIGTFGDYVAGFGEFNDFNGASCEYGPFFTRLDPDHTESGRIALVIPAALKNQMRQPINARIVAVSRKRTVKNYQLSGTGYSNLFEEASLTPVTVDAGSGRGIKRNSLLRLIGEPSGQYLRIVSVARNSSRGVVIRSLEKGQEVYSAYDPMTKDYVSKPLARVRIGTHVTTSPVTDF